MGDGVVDGGDAGLQAVLTEAAPVVDGGLGGLHGGHHGLNGLDGVLAGGGLAGEHHAGGAVEYGVGHVGDLGTGGTGVADHGVQHLGGGDDGLAGHGGSLDHLLLEDGHLLSGDLHAQVAAGNHDAVGCLDDLLQVVHALAVLNLGDDADVVAAVLVQAGADVLHVAGLPDEGSGDEVEVVLSGELQVLLVLLSEGGQQDVDIGDVDGLIVGQGAAVLHDADDLLALDLLDQQVDQAVVHQDMIAGGHLVVQVGIGNGNPLSSALALSGGEGEDVVLLQLDAAVLEGLDADLGALGIQDSSHGDTQLVPDALELGQLSQVALVGAVGEVEAGGVHAGKDQLTDHFLAVHGGTQSADNFCLSHIGHG